MEIQKKNFFDPSSEEYQYSLEMCRTVAERGHIESQFIVGFAYEHSVLEKNYVEAHK
jgi:TPR repeat protein